MKLPFFQSLKTEKRQIKLKLHAIVFAIQQQQMSRMKTPHLY